MTAKKLFRGIIITKFIAGFIFFLLYHTFKSSLPHEVISYEDYVKKTFFSQHQQHILFENCVLLILLITRLFDYILLYLLRPFAKPLYLFLVIIDTIWITIIPSVDILTNITVGIYRFSTMLDGMILLLLYWSPLSEYFISQNKYKRPLGPPPLPPL